MNMNFVERDPNRGFGQPVIIGRRLTVYTVVSMARNSAKIVDFLNDFELTANELASAVHYCKNRLCDKMTSSLDQYCDGCMLRSLSDGWSSIKDDYIEFDGISISKDGKSFFLGSLDELEESEFGIIGWLYAREVEKLLCDM